MALWQHVRKSRFNWIDYMANPSSQKASPQTAKTVLNEFRLVRLDMEMTGLDPEKERIIEVAVVVTEPDLTIVAEGPVLVIHQPDALLDAMDSWNRSTHGKSGLTDKVKASTLTEAQAEDQLIAFLAQHVPAGKSPLCGNTVSQDRRFMFNYMPKLEQFFHYRTVDVSTIKELARRWRPELLKGFEKRSKHEALADIYESIDELKYYRETFIKLA
jgi:oligoribonuclease